MSGKAPWTRPIRSWGAFLFDACTVITDKCGVHLVPVDTCYDTHLSNRAGGGKMNAADGWGGVGWGCCSKFSSESVLVLVSGSQKRSLTEKWVCVRVCEGLAKTDEGKITGMTAFRYD